MMIQDRRQTMQIREMTADDIDPVIALWQDCGLTRPWNDQRADITFAMAGPASTGLVGVVDGAIAASVLVGHDGHRGAVYYVSVHPDHRGSGFGGRIMDAAETWLRSEGVWKLNLLVRRENDDVVKFYGAIGYEDQECVALGKRLDGRPDRHDPDNQDDNQNDNQE